MILNDIAIGHRTTMLMLFNGIKPPWCFAAPICNSMTRLSMTAHVGLFWQRVQLLPHISVAIMDGEWRWRPHLSVAESI
jgi:hypothetical protein